MKLGISLSQRKLEELGIKLETALEESLKYNFSLIRLSLYWNETETKRDKFNFSKIKKILNFYEKNKQDIVLSIGVKAQRWPEYYWPDFIENKNSNNETTQKLILKFLKQSIKELKKYNCIKYWQIENEAIDPSGPENQQIPLAFLKKEIKTIKKLDSRPIIGTAWGNDLIKRKSLEKLTPLTKIIGLDLYYKQFIGETLGKAIYLGPQFSSKKLEKHLGKFPENKFWITELQAEPWEKDENTYLSANPKSISPQLLEKNIEKVLALPIETILFWGFEYWLWKKLNGDNSYFEFIQNLKIDYND